MANYLDIALDIGEINPHTGGMRATPYFEDYLYQIIQSIGGEGADTATEENQTALVSSIRSKVAKIESDINNINPADRTVMQAAISRLESNLKEIDTTNVYPIRAEVAKLNKKRIDHDQVLAGLINEIGFLRQLVNKMRSGPVKDFYLEVSKGNVPGHTAVGVFGEAPSGVQTTASDIWARADATPTQQIWLAPTAARIHTIASSSASDTTGGVGANSVTVYYLPNWSTAETTETVTGNLNAGVAMSNAAVMINKMVVNPQSTSTSANVGTITATAATDATITAVILPGEGKTAQAIFGFHSTATAYVHRWSGGIDKATGVEASADFQIRFNPNPNQQTTVFIRARDADVQSTGSTYFEHKYANDNSFRGPGIIKVQAIASAADVDGHSDFDLTLVEDGF